MKKIALILMVLILVIGSAAGSYFTKQDFLASAVALNASATKVNVSDFTSVDINCANYPANALLTLTFTRAAGSSSTVDFYLQVSFDNGTTYSDYRDPIADAEYFSLATNHAVLSGTTVRVSRIINLAGVSHVRLAKLINNDGSNNLTAVNATLSW